jgi:glycine cleavage system H protein
MQIHDCEFPDDVYFDVSSDVWLRPLSERRAIVGATSILSFLAGRLKSVNLKNNLTFVKAGQNLATVESAKYFGAIRTPIEGKVIELNQILAEKPSTINDAPYSEGWVAKIETAESLSAYLSKNDGNRLLSGIEAIPKLEDRINEMKVHCFKKLPDEELVAVGLECAVTLVNLSSLLSSKPAGTVVHVVSDDPLADIEMIRWADQTKNALIETKTEGNLYHFIVEKTHS